MNDGCDDWFCVESPEDYGVTTVYVKVDGKLQAYQSATRDHHQAVNDVRRVVPLRWGPVLAMLPGGKS